MSLCVVTNSLIVLLLLRLLLLFYFRKNDDDDHVLSDSEIEVCEGRGGGGKRVGGIKGMMGYGVKRVVGGSV